MSRLLPKDRIELMLVIGAVLVIGGAVATVCWLGMT